ncbi:MAG: hypothetical protein WA825_14365 [Steroidobacteraceae bacterium]
MDSETIPRLLPKAIAWAEARSGEIARSGVPLTRLELRLAHLVGVQEPERVRILEVSEVPRPQDPELRQAAEAMGLLGPHTIGLTLGHGIYIVAGYSSNRLVSHECRHVYQYEVAGSIGKYLPVYLNQIASVGYEAAPLEVDARAHECDTA